MYQNSDHYPDYGDSAGQIDYLHPDYYQQDADPANQTEQRYSDFSNMVNGSKLTSNEYMPVKAYRGPSDIPGYTTDPGAEQHRAGESPEQPEGKKGKKGLAGLGGIGATIVALLVKFKWLLVFAKFGFAGVSALISVAVYALFFGWPFAIGIVVLLFLHEMGHALVMKLKGIPIGALVFVPMLGAAVTMSRMPQNARDEAEVGIAGPIAGAIASSACLAIATTMHYAGSIWAPLAYFGFFINLLNLIPIVPFDGGRVLAAIDRRVWILGFLGLLAYEVWSWLNGNPSTWLIFFIVIAGMQLWSRNTAAGSSPQARAYYEVPMVTRITMSLLYFGLVAVLVLGMSMSRSLMPLMQ